MTKKQKIIDAAIELFAKQGIETTTIQQITAYSGISKGAFYLSFPSKDALILEMIDYFMKLITANIDHLVNEAKKEKLTVYFEATFTSLAEYAEFARILMLENFSLTGEDILSKMMYYEQLADELLGQILLAEYGERIEPIIYELIMLVKSFMKSYTMLLFMPHEQVDIKRLSESLVEKTEILAMYTTKAYLTHPVHAGMKTDSFTKAQICEELVQVAQLDLSPLAKDSVQIVREELATEKPRIALLTGMLANLEEEPKMGWCCYMLRRYIKEQQALLSV
ncbi:MAG: TetR/AcrR family transcriptional regulator [Solibacillus sp.]